MTDAPLPLQTGKRYTRVAIALHWIIAALILFNLLGFFYAPQSASPTWRAIFMPIHISSGITILLFSVIRVLWRLLHVPPPHPEGTRYWEKGLSQLVHFLLYAAIIVMPITGWGIISSHPPEGSSGQAYKYEQRLMAAQAEGRPAPPQRRQPEFWWAVTIPAIAPISEIGETPGGVPPQDKLHDDFVEWHQTAAFGLLALLVLHLADAMKHEWLDRRPSLMRMGVNLDRGKHSH